MKVRTYICDMIFVLGFQKTNQSDNVLLTGSLPEISQKISNSINSVTDVLATALMKFSDEELDELLPLFQAHLPQTLSELAFHKVKELVPKQYIINAIASCLASKIVYKG